jgi:hypothetical protein
MMASTTSPSLEQIIGKQESTWVKRVLRSQTFWVIVAIIIACPELYRRVCPEFRRTFFPSLYV